MTRSHPGQEVSYVEAGSEGRLIRALMKLAREEPDWVAVGPVIRFIGDRGKTRLKQRVERRPT